ncbi:MAG: hypothetical protein V3U76_03410 [Granulosicoccus sp.]
MRGFAPGCTAIEENQEAAYGSGSTRIKKNVGEGRFGLQARMRLLAE